jgi:hypothetical protein
MRYFRRAENPNNLVAIFMLVLLAVVAGPNTLPRIIASIVPGADEGVPCAWLRPAQNRSAHQSLLGRSAENPLSVAVESGPLPSGSEGDLVINIIVINNTMGTVPILYNPNQVRIGDDGASSGLGITFDSSNPLPAGAPQGNTFIPETDIRVLGPRQRCVHTFRFAVTNLPFGGIATGNASVKAYYRNTSPGAAQSPDPLATPIYNDQGLWVGIVESPSVIIPLASQ